MSSSTPILKPDDKTNKQRILTAMEYTNLCDFINDYQGLSIDCELDLINNFPKYNRLTLKMILETELNGRMRTQHWRYDANAKIYMQMYEQRSKECVGDNSILLNIAREENISPIMMCRSLLKSKYEKKDITKILRFPFLIDDPILSANVAQCLCSDSQDGPLVDLRRRALGEEYEVKLKQRANAIGMHYYEENDLRRLGYDRTPDIKMILPFLYKEQVINWIESKACFGDIKTHRMNIQQQLHSYCERFGAGIVIYWFGYHEDTPNLSDNSIGIIVLDDFPAKADIVLLDLSESKEFVDEDYTRKSQ